MRDAATRLVSPRLNSGISDNAGPVLARFLLRHNQRTDAPNVFRRSAAGRDGGCAKIGEADVIYFRVNLLDLKDGPKRLMKASVGH